MTHERIVCACLRRHLRRTFTLVCVLAQTSTKDVYARLCVCADIYEGRLRSFARVCADIYEGTTAASGLVKKLCGAIAKQYTSSHHDVFIRVLATDVQHFDMVPKFDMLITIFQHGRHSDL